MAYLSIPLFQKIKTGLNKVDQVIEKLAETLRGITAKPILDGQIVSVSLGAGNNAVAHGLGRDYVGYIMILSSAQITHKNNAAGTLANTPADKFIIIDASGAAVVSIWIF